MSDGGLIMTDGERAGSAEVELAHRAFYEAWERGSAEDAIEQWVDTDVVTLAFPGCVPSHGRSAVHRLIREAVALTPGIQFFFEDVHVWVRGETALLACVENAVMPGQLMMARGPDESMSRLAVTSTYVLTPGGWRLASHMSGPILSQEAE